MNQKSLIIIVIIIVLVLVGGYLGRHKIKSLMSGSTPQTTTQTTTAPTTDSQANSTTTGQNQIQIQNFNFSPATMTVKVGDKVTWTNQDSAGHSATADDNSFDTGVLSTGQSGSITFSKAGTFSYHCSVHPSMKATIIVQ